LNETDPRPVGLLAGHIDGITFVDSKHDGRYLVTNSKDQSIKLWDIRLVSTFRFYSFPYHFHVYPSVSSLLSDFIAEERVPWRMKTELHSSFIDKSFLSNFPESFPMRTEFWLVERQGTRTVGTIDGNVSPKDVKLKPT